MSKTKKVLRLDWIQGKIVSAKLQNLPKTGAQTRLDRADNVEPLYIEPNKADLYGLTVNDDGSVSLPCCKESCEDFCEEDSTLEPTEE